MPTEVTCPQCHHTLHLPHDVAKAKLQCKHCQHIFVASTSPPQPRSNKAKASDRAPDNRHYTVRKKPNTAAVVLTLVGAVAVIVFSAVAAYLYLYPSIELAFDDGTVWYSGRISRDQKDAKIEEFRQLKTARAAQAFQQQERVVQRPQQRAARQQTTESQTAQQSQPQLPPQPKLTKDPKIRIEGLRKEFPPGNGYGYALAYLSNDYDKPLRRAVVQFSIYNAQGAEHKLKPVTVEYVPAGERIQLAVKILGYQPEQIARLDYSLGKVEVGQNLVVQMVEVDFNRQTGELSAWIANKGQVQMQNPGLHAVFLDDLGAAIFQTTIQPIKNAPTDFGPGKLFFFKQAIVVKAFVVPKTIQARIFGQEGIQY